MGNLKVKKTDIELLGKKYKVLFTVNAIYDTEELFEKEIADVFKELDLKNKDICKTVYMIVAILINSNKENEKINISELIESADTTQFMYLYNCLIATINESFFIKKVKDDCDYAEEVKKEHGEVNLCERMFTVCHEMGYRDNEIWEMTPRQVLCLFGDLGKYRTGDEPRKTIDDIL